MRRQRTRSCALSWADLCASTTNRRAGAEPLYALFGDVKAEDWSTDLDRGHAQSIDIVVWSEKGGARTALMAADRFFAILDDAPLTLDGHRLVNLRVTELASGRDKDTGLARVTLRLRAVTEVA